MRLSGRAAGSREKWKFKQWGLVEVAGSANGAAPVAVHMSAVHVHSIAHGNGVRFAGAVAATLEGCTVERAQWSGIIGVVCTGARLRDCAQAL